MRRVSGEFALLLNPYNFPYNSPQFCRYRAARADAGTFFVKNS